MAITSNDIHNQSFSIGRKGYDVDEVDVFLEHVANEIDALNAQIEQLEGGFDSHRFDGFDTPATSIIEPVVDESALAEKDELIADLERQLEAKKADDNAIAQALIIAQRSADEILANANSKSAATIQEAENEAQRILDKAEADKQKVHDAIDKLRDDREDVREEYQELLSDFINDATRKLAEIASATPVSAHARVGAGATVAPVAFANHATPAPTLDGAGAYSTPQNLMTGAVAVAAAPSPSPFEKDLSGFGDADDAFEFDEID